MSKDRVNFWFYPIWYFCLIGLTSGAIALLDYYYSFTLRIEVYDWLKFLILLPILATLLSTNLPDFISNKVKNRLKWLHTRPGINQFYYLIAVQILAIIVSSILKITYNSNYLIGIIDTLINVTAVLTVTFYMIMLLRIIHND